MLRIAEAKPTIPSCMIFRASGAVFDGKLAAKKSAHLATAIGSATRASAKAPMIARFW
jgi:hypothetical protein